MSTVNTPFGRWRRGALLLAALLLQLPAQGANAGRAQLASDRESLQQGVRAAERAPRPALALRGQLLQPPRHFDVQLAPDGRHVSYRRRDAQRTGLYLRDLDSGREQRLLADVGDMQLQWSGDGRRLWLADALGLALHEVGSAGPRRLYKWDQQRRQQFWGAPDQAPRFALIREQLAIQGQRTYRYLRIDVRGETVELHSGRQALRELLLHSDGSLAFSHGYEGPQFESVVRRHHAQGSEAIHRCGFTQRCRLLAYADDGRSLYLVAPDAGGLLALQRWQADAPKLQVLHRDPAARADASFPLWLDQQQTWLAVAYHPDRRRWSGRNRDVEAQLAALQARLPEANLDLSSDRNGARWLVSASRSDWQAARYFLYRPDRDVLTELFESAIDEAPSLALAPTLPLSWRASDGMLLHGYVTLPLGVAATRAPLIALPHGGPYNRDRDGFDPLVQLLANRGYAVLQPNFRGSTGYGQAYVTAAGGEFGDGRVLQDIIDGLDVLLDEGIGDADRQAMMGHSFGGFASLLAAVHRPQRFRVIVASAAPVDLGFSMRQMAAEGGSGLPEDGPPAEVLLPHYGMPFADADWHARMRRDSPLAQVARVVAPVYLWAGKKDDRVLLADIVHFAVEARRHGRQTELLIDPDSGHNPDTPRNLEALLWLYERAASRHLGGMLETPSPALQPLVDQRFEAASHDRQASP